MTTDRKFRLAVMASGNGGNFEAIARACQNGEIPAQTVICVCDRPGAKVCQRARNLGIEVLEISVRDFASKADYEKAIADRLESEGVDLICLAGYMRIVGKVLLSRFPKKIINIHPALLPSFKGAHAIKDALDFGVKVFGVTIHYIDETVDGGEIIAQRAFPYDGNNLEELEEMVHAIEHPLYVETIRKIVSENR